MTDLKTATARDATPRLQPAIYRLFLVGMCTLTFLAGPVGSPVKVYGINPAQQAVVRAMKYPGSFNILVSCYLCVTASPFDDWTIDNRPSTETNRPK
jgi:hypothetical protein